MTLINNINVVNENLQYNIYGSQEVFILKNVSIENDVIYKFKDPQIGAEGDMFIIQYFGNLDKIIDELNYEIAHYILSKHDENSKYLVSVDLFKQIFTPQS